MMDSRLAGRMLKFVVRSGHADGCSFVSGVGLCDCDFQDLRRDLEKNTTGEFVEMAYAEAEKTLCDEIIARLDVRDALLLKSQIPLITRRVVEGLWEVEEEVSSVSDGELQTMAARLGDSTALVHDADCTLRVRDVAAMAAELLGYRGRLAETSTSCEHPDFPLFRNPSGDILCKGCNAILFSVDEVKERYRRTVDGT